MSTFKAPTQPLKEPNAVTVAPSPAGSTIVPAIDLLRVFSPDQWEDFALEWTHSLKGRYQRVERSGGAGDLGRDVVAFVSDDEWHNDQCKHYRGPLQPNQVVLEAMGESSYLLQMYGDKSCDYCGAEPEHQRHADAHAPESTLQAAQAEAAKVQRLRAELRVAADQMSTEQRALATSLREIDAAIQEISGEIEAALVPKVRGTANELRATQGSYGAFVRVEQLRAQIDSLQKQLHESDATPDKTEKLEFIKLTTTTMSNVCSRIRELFTAWRVAGEVTVAFDEKSADLVVNGRKRTSHGKGVRAVMCAGYVIGLMQEALAANTGHPGFVLLDTPLNPYIEADADDDGEVANSVKDAFYRDLCSSSALGQVIVFENVAPPADVQASCNHVHFSKSSAGRYGFLPVSAAP